MRKLAGRLLCEALDKSPSNQDFFCKIAQLDCSDALYGQVSLNRNIPGLIKKKLAAEPEFLLSLHRMDKLKVSGDGADDENCR